MKVQIDQLLQVRAHDLVRVNEDDLFQIHREKDVEEQDFVTPDDSLLLFLCAQPRRPFVRYKLVLKLVRLCEMGNKLLRGTLEGLSDNYAWKEYAQGRMVTKSSL